ncbi:hypothetical protein E2P81_ATG08628 [Venturia nashicola]|nr:hypothetical protein E2P81_ATG08628 [Venturia nashicola]
MKNRNRQGFSDIDLDLNHVKCADRLCEYSDDADKKRLVADTDSGDPELAALCQNLKLRRQSREPSNQPSEPSPFPRRPNIRGSHRQIISASDPVEQPGLGPRILLDRARTRRQYGTFPLPGGAYRHRVRLAGRRKNCT